MKNIFKSGLLACLATVLFFAGCKKDDDDSKFVVTLSANNTEWGTVAGGGEFADGTEIQIMATANRGYRFEKWSDDDTNNPRTITVTKNIALIAIFAEGNGGGTVNGGGNDNNNNSGNTGTAIGDILPKKVTKIVETVEDSDGTFETIYLFDSYGKLISKTEDGSVYTYTYTDNKISVNNDGIYFNLENGRIVCSETSGTAYYAYSSDGYLTSIADSRGDIYLTFVITNGNATSWVTSDKTYTIEYSDNLNNLNVDVAILINRFNYEPIPGYYGERNKNLPSTTVYSGKPINYTYDGNYLTKINGFWENYRYSAPATWEIFYE